MVHPKKVLILCTGNSARSQMAEGLLRHYGEGRFQVESAGMHPSLVRPEAIAVMRDIGIDISTQRSKSVEEFLASRFDYVITVCDQANESCPVFRGTPRRLHWSIRDPAALEGDEQERLQAFSKARDQLTQLLQEFISVESSQEGE